MILPQENDYNHLIQQFKSTEKLSEQLSFVLTLLYSLDGSKQELFHNDILRYERLFSDLNFMRKVKYRDSLVQDYPTEYFGDDKGGGDPFSYDVKVEKSISKIQLDIMGVLGRVIKVLKESELTIEDTI